jgi:hypothetical protein
MPFSAATCLTSTPLNVSTFDIFLGQNNYTTPFISDVSLSDLTSPNCPYIIENIPNGTTYLSFKDSSGIYCFSIPVVNNDICSNCNLGFSNYSSSTVSRLYCGVLTGSCQNVSDYKINWYGPNDTTTLAFTSGKGIFINDVDYEHPFSTQSTSIPLSNGVYTPIIEKVVLSGLTFSNTGGTGNIKFSGSCLPNTTILPLNCIFKTNTDTRFPYSAYTNYLSFDYESEGTPVPVTVTHVISASTKFLAWAFKGEGDPDKILIEFSGSSYPNKIGVEDILIGNEITSNNFSASTYPKSASTNAFFTKITCLTGITVNDNEILNITITPTTTLTKWELYITCLDDYNCNDCLSTKDYKIIGSSISGITATCDTLEVKFKISGCSVFDSDSDYVLYDNTTVTTNYFDNSYVLGLNSIISRTTGFQNLFYSNYRCVFGGGTLLTSCTNDSEETIYNKTFLTDGSHRGVFEMTGSSNFISTYYNSLVNSFSGLPPYSPGWSGSTNPYVNSFYRCYTMRIPSYESPDNCGDSGTIIPYLDIDIHHTSQFVSGTTSGKFFLKITANTLTDLNLFNSCQISCETGENYIISQVNRFSTGNTISTGNYYINFTNGNYYSNPIYKFITLNTGTTSESKEEVIGYFRTQDWVFNTYPFSGNPSTILPSLSGSVCNYNNTGVNTTTFNSYYKTQYKYYYEVRLTNPSNVNDFDIWASPITNFSYSGAPAIIPFYELAYRYSGGSVTYSSSTYII